MKILGVSCYCLLAVEQSTTAIQQRSRGMAWVDSVCEDSVRKSSKDNESNMRAQVRIGEEGTRAIWTISCDARCDADLIIHGAHRAFFFNHRPYPVETWSSQVFHN